MAYIPLGYFLSPRGMKGEILIRLYRGDKIVPKKSDEIVIFEKAEEKTFLVEESFLSGKERVLKIKESECVDFARHLKGVEFFIETSEEETIPFLGKEIISYKVIDKKRGELGEVVNFSILPSYILLNCSSLDSDFEIPFVKELIREVNKIRKNLIVDLPEGYPGIDNED